MECQKKRKRRFEPKSLVAQCLPDMIGSLNEKEYQELQQLIKKENQRRFLPYLKEQFWKCLPSWATYKPESVLRFENILGNGLEFVIKTNGIVLLENGLKSNKRLLLALKNSQHWSIHCYKPYRSIVLDQNYQKENVIHRKLSSVFNTENEVLITLEMTREILNLLRKYPRIKYEAKKLFSY